MPKKLALNTIIAISAILYPILCIIRWWRKDVSVRVLVYHKTSPHRPGVPTTWNVPPEIFEKQIESLAVRNFQFLTAEDLLLYLSGKMKPSRKSIFITFDDGYLDNYRYAFPILQKYSATATFYISTKYIDSGMPLPFLSRATVTADDSLLPLSSAHLKEMQIAGMGIASHSHDHVDYLNLSNDEMSEQIRISEDKLTALVGPGLKSFVVPYGLWGRPADELKKVLRALGFKYAFLGRWGAVRSGCEVYDLPRVPIYGTDGLISFFLKTRGATDWVGTLHSHWHRYRTGSNKELYGKAMECN